MTAVTNDSVENTLVDFDLDLLLASAPTLISENTNTNNNVNLHQNLGYENFTDGSYDGQNEGNREWAYQGQQHSMGHMHMQNTNYLEIERLKLENNVLKSENNELKSENNELKLAKNGILESFHKKNNIYEQLRKQHTNLLAELAAIKKDHIASRLAELKASMSVDEMNGKLESQYEISKTQQEKINEQDSLLDSYKNLLEQYKSQHQQVSKEQQTMEEENAKLKRNTDHKDCNKLISNLKYKNKTITKTACLFAEVIKEKNPTNSEDNKLIEKYYKKSLKSKGAIDLDIGSPNVDSGRESSISNYSPAYSIINSPMNTAYNNYNSNEQKISLVNNVSNNVKKMMIDASTNTSPANKTVDIATSPIIFEEKLQILAIPESKSIATSPIHFADVISAVDQIKTSEIATSPIKFSETKSVNIATSPIPFVDNIALGAKTKISEIAASPVYFTSKSPMANTTNTAFSHINYGVSPTSVSNKKTVEIICEQIMIHNATTRISPTNKTLDVAASPINLSGTRSPVTDAEVLDIASPSELMNCSPLCDTYTSSPVSMGAWDISTSPTEFTNATKERDGAASIKSLTQTDLATDIKVRPKEYDNLKPSLAKTPVKVIVPRDMTRPISPASIASRKIPGMFSKSHETMLIEPANETQLFKMPAKTRPVECADARSRKIKTKVSDLDNLESTYMSTTKMDIAANKKTPRKPCEKSITEQLKDIQSQPSPISRKEEEGCDLEIRTILDKFKLKWGMLSPLAITPPGEDVPDESESNRRNDETETSKESEPLFQIVHVSEDEESDYEIDRDDYNITYENSSQHDPIAHSHIDHLKNIKQTDSKNQTPYKNRKSTETDTPKTKEENFKGRKQTEYKKSKKLSNLGKIFKANTPNCSIKKELSNIFNSNMTHKPYSISTRSKAKEGQTDMIQNREAAIKIYKESFKSSFGRPQLLSETGSESENRIQTSVTSSNITSLKLQSKSENEIQTPEYSSRITSLESQSKRGNRLQTAVTSSKITSLEPQSNSENRLQTALTSSKITDGESHSESENRIQTSVTSSKITCLEPQSKSENELQTPEYSSRITSLESHSECKNRLHTSVISSRITSLESQSNSGNRLQIAVTSSKKSSLEPQSQSENELQTPEYSSRITSLESHSERENKLQTTITSLKITSLESHSKSENRIQTTVPSYLLPQPTAVTSSKITSLESQSKSENKVFQFIAVKNKVGVKTSRKPSSLLQTSTNKLQSVPKKNVTSSAELNIVDSQPLKVQKSIPKSPETQSNLKLKEDNLSISKQTRSMDTDIPLIEPTVFARKRTICRPIEAPSARTPVSTKLLTNSLLECNTSTNVSTKCDSDTYSFIKPPTKRISRVSKNVSNNPPSVSNNQSENISGMKCPASETNKQDSVYAPLPKRAKFVNDQNDSSNPPIGSHNQSENVSGMKCPASETNKQDSVYASLPKRAKFVNDQNDSSNPRIGSNDEGENISGRNFPERETSKNDIIYTPTPKKATSVNNETNNASSTPNVNSISSQKDQIKKSKEIEVNNVSIEHLSTKNDPVSKLMNSTSLDFNINPKFITEPTPNVTARTCADYNDMAIFDTQNVTVRTCADYNDMAIFDTQNVTASTLAIFDTQNQKQKQLINKMEHVPIDWRHVPKEWSSNLFDRMVYLCSTKKPKQVKKINYDLLKHTILENGISKCVQASKDKEKYLKSLQKFAEELSKEDERKLSDILLSYLRSAKRKAQFVPERKDHSKFNSKQPPTKHVQVWVDVIHTMDQSGFGLMEKVLKSCEYVLFTLEKGASPTFDVLESVTHLFVNICKFANNSSKIILFILNAMYTLTFKAIPLVMHCLDLVPDVLPKAVRYNRYMERYPEMTPLMRCTIFLLHFYNCDDRSKRLEELRRRLNRQYFYELSDENETTILFSLKQSITNIHNDNFYGKNILRFALLNLAKRRGTKWCHKNLIQKIFLPIIKENTHGKEFCLQVIGQLMKPYKKEMTVHTEEVVNLLVNLFAQTQHDAEKEDILLGLLGMDMATVSDRINHCLSSWNPPNISQPLLQALQTNFMSKPVHHWSDFYKKCKEI